MREHPGARAGGPGPVARRFRLARTSQPTAPGLAPCGPVAKFRPSPEENRTLRLSLAACLSLACLPPLFAAGAPAAPAAGRAETAAPPTAPLVFIANQGQIPAPARYYALQPRGAAYFEPEAVVLDRESTGAADRGLLVRVTFPHHDAGLKARAAAPQAARVNSIIGDDPARWRSALPTFAEVRYEGIAPGADLIYRVADGRLKYDVRVAPGADLRGVRLRYEGVRALALDPAGALLLRSAAGDLREAAPVLYQEKEGRLLAVRGGYRLVSDTEVGFWAADLDPRLPLVIDPEMVWSSFLGGSGDDLANRVLADTDGGLIVVGATGSSDYPTTAGAYSRTSAGSRDVFVTKLRSDGTGLLWSTYLGGAGADEARSAALAPDGYIYLCGRTGSTDFPVTAHAFQRTYGGGLTDGFLARLAPTGGSLAFCTLLGGASDDYAAAVAVDGSGRPTVAGVTASGDFPTTPDVVRPSWSPSFFDGAEGFVARLSATGSELDYSTFLGGGSADGISGLALDDQGRPLVVGNTRSSTFPITAGAVRTALGGSKDGFVTRLSSDASAYLYSSYLGGGDADAAIAAAIDAAGNAYVTGYTASADFPTTSGALQETYNGGGAYDGFVCKLAPSGGSLSLSYATYLGGDGQDIPLALSVASDGRACVAGYTASDDFPTTAAAFDATANGGDDAFVAALAPDGRSLSYSSYLGAPGTDDAYSIAVLDGGRVALCGSTTDASFPTTVGAFDRTHASPGGLDGFVTVLDIGEGPTLAVGGAGLPGLSLAPPRPSPFTERTVVRMTLGRVSPVEVVVADVRGRAVATIARGELSAGPHAWAWDGRGDDGAPVASGLYWICATAADSRQVRAVVRLR